MLLKEVFILSICCKIFNFFLIASTRDSNKLSNPLKKNQKLLQLKDKLPSLGSAVPKPVPKIVPIPMSTSNSNITTKPTLLQSPPRNTITTTNTITPPPAVHPIKKDLSPPPQQTSTTSTSITSSGSSGPSASDLELRKNIIHYLGPAPLSWSTLQEKLPSIGDKDLATAVNKVATMKPSSSGPLYHLRKQFLSDIDLDWPNYNDDDKKKIRDLKNSATTATTSASTSSKQHQVTPPPKKPVVSTSATTTTTTTTTPPAKIAPPTNIPTPVAAPATTTTGNSNVKSEDITSNNMDIDTSLNNNHTIEDVVNTSTSEVSNPSKKLKRERVASSNATSTASAIPSKDDVNNFI